MPPVLHPRSRTTLSLFTSTLVLSFVVVALPHIIPCPVPHRTRMYADGELPNITEDGKRRRRKIKSKDDIDAEAKKAAVRECPIPKPKGLVGEILGFKTQDGEPVPPIRVERYTGSTITRSREPKES
jgi:cytochrome c oxidase assembly factor 2